MRDADAVRRALDGVDAVVHLAARVGVGQSMYELAEYTSANSLGTAVLLEALAERPVRKLVVASSMSIYGEGLYTDGDGREVEPPERTREQLAAREWDYAGLEPVPTPGAQAAGPLVDLRAHEVRPGARLPRRRAPRTGSRRWRCGSSTRTARGRRSRTRTPACSRSSRRGC